MVKNTVFTAVLVLFLYPIWGTAHAGVDFSMLSGNIPNFEDEFDAMRFGYKCWGNKKVIETMKDKRDMFEERIKVIDIGVAENNLDFKHSDRQFYHDQARFLYMAIDAATDPDYSGKGASVRIGWEWVR